MNNSIYAGLDYSVTLINVDFRIKVSGVDLDGTKLNTLVGVSGLINLLGIELVNTLIGRAYKYLNGKCVCKLRRGLKVTFYTR